MNFNLEQFETEKYQARKNEINKQHNYFQKKINQMFPKTNIEDLILNQVINKIGTEVQKDIIDKISAELLKIQQEENPTSKKVFKGAAYFPSKVIDHLECITQMEEFAYETLLDIAEIEKEGIISCEETILSNKLKEKDIEKYQKSMKRIHKESTSFFAYMTPIIDNLIHLIPTYYQKEYTKEMFYKSDALISIETFNNRLKNHVITKLIKNKKMKEFYGYKNSLFHSIPKIKINSNCANNNPTQKLRYKIEVENNQIDFFDFLKNSYRHIISNTLVSIQLMVYPATNTQAYEFIENNYKNNELLN